MTHAHLGRWESFWAPGSYSAVVLGDDEAVVGRLVYTCANPVDAGLVRSHTEWPGARSLLDEMNGPPETIRRPEGFFRTKGPVPEAAELRLFRPPTGGADDPNWLFSLKERIRIRESEIVAKLEREGRRFLGRDRVLRESPLSRPRSIELRRGLKPRVAAQDKWKRIESLQRLKSFLSEYRAAWRAFCGGDHSVVFPFGTYLMKMRFGVCCNGP